MYHMDNTRLPPTPPCGDGRPLGSTEKSPDSQHQVLGKCRSILESAGQLCQTSLDLLKERDIEWRHQ